MKLVLLRLDFGEVGSGMIEGGLELRVFRLEEREVGWERYELAFEERTGLLGGYGGGVGVSPEGLELSLEVANEGVGPLRHGRAVVAEAGEFLVGEENRHRDSRLIFDWLIDRWKMKMQVKWEKERRRREGIWRDEKGKEEGREGKSPLFFVGSLLWASIIRSSGLLGWAVHNRRFFLVDGKYRALSSSAKI